MAWVDLIICFFFGCFGVHKFREKKIKLGLLYLFTVGFFGFGWLYDCVRYLFIAIKTSPNRSSTAPKENTTSPEKNSVHPSPNNKDTDSHFPVVRWLITGILILIALSCFPNLTGCFACLLALLSIPIQAWQSKIDQFIPKKFKSAFSIILAILTLISFPSAVTQSNYNPSETSYVIGSSPSGENESTNHVSSEISSVSPSSPSSNPIIIPSSSDDAKSTESDSHIHTFIAATCTCPEICSECGEMVGNSLGHEWLDATCSAPKTCTRCGETDGVPAEHMWQDATCRTPKTCTVCSATEGSTTDHLWGAATCTSAKMCSSCGITEGSSLGHSWNEATCIASKTCSRCGATEGGTISHQYSDGDCIHCGADDPNYADETMVWIPTKGGSKYHSRSNCSNMEDPRQVTEEEAIRLGFGRCKRCH